MLPYLNPTVMAYNRLMANSFQHFTGTSILGFTGATDLDDDLLARTMFELPQPIVSHGTQADPIFRYANAQALTLWEMDWDAFTRLPSRLSAEATSDIQSDRDTLLKSAPTRGWVDHYSGARISRNGQRFIIQKTILWNVVDGTGNLHGQAAFIRDWRRL